MGRNEYILNSNINKRWNIDSVNPYQFITGEKSCSQSGSITDSFNPFDDDAAEEAGYSDIIGWDHIFIGSMKIEINTIPTGGIISAINTADSGKNIYSIC